MKRFALIALAFVALLEVGLVFQGEAQQVGLSGSSVYIPPPSATRAWFRAMLGDTIRAWHNYDIYFPKTPAASQADGSRMFNFTTTVSTDPSNSGAEWTGLYSAINKTSQTTGVMTLNGIEGVARAQGKSIGATLRGVYGRTYASADTHKVTTMIGGDFSSRSASGWKPKFGTAFVGVRIYMANGSTAAMGQDSINNYHGLWIYDENTSGLATTNAIKIGTGGARFKYDLALQDGQTITDTTRGTIFNKPILSPATFSDTLRMRSDTTVALIFLRGRADSAWAFKARNGTTTWKTLIYQDTAGNTIIGGTSVALTIASGGGNVNALRYYTNATANPLEIFNAIAPHRVFIGGRAAGDSSGGGVMIDSTGGGTVLRAPTGKVLVVICDTLKLKFRIAKHAFGNAAANLTDTILVAGATATSVIVGGDYIPDGASVTYNALRKRVVVDTVFIYRVAITDPDSIGALTLIK